MGLRRDKRESWARYQEASARSARARWEREAETARARLPEVDAKSCAYRIRHHFALLEAVGILGPGEQKRVQLLDLSELAGSDQTRLRGTGRHVDYAVIGLTGRPPEQPLIERALQVMDSRRLRGGSSPSR